jgi:hypothetical protein
MSQQDRSPWRRIVAVVATVLVATPAWAAPRVAGVSPGAPVGDEATASPIEVVGACSPFSWTDVAAATGGYELLVFDLGAGAERPVLRQRLPAGAYSWTPGHARCLTAGHEYAWVVRSLRADEPPSAADAPATVASPADAGPEWSEPLRFRVAGTPSAEELAAALAVLERWRAAQGAAGGGGGGEAGAAGGGGWAPSGGADVVPKVDPGGSVAAVRADIPDTSGAAYGVLAISHSASGAGVAARNEAGGGPDLVLDGAAAGAVDATFTEAGLDRASASAQTFNVRNSGGGGMALQVSGEAVDTASTAIAWSRLTSVPAGFADGVDNDTTYLAGNQLSLVATTFNVVEGHLSGLDADTLDGAHLASLQNRVTGTCPLGLTLQGINADGTVVCYAAAGPPTATTVVDPGANTGEYTSIAIGTDGFPVISYYDASATALNVAKCNDAACTGGDETITQVDNAATVGLNTSIAIGTDGFPVISYRDSSATALKVAKCDDAACAPGGETITPVDNAADVGLSTSIAIGTDGFPVISYYDVSNSALNVAKCDDAACAPGGETITQVDNASITGAYTSIAIGTDGFPVISYYDAGTNTALNVAKCNDAACAPGGETITQVDNAATVGQYTSLAIGTDGFPVISYYDLSNSALKVAKCNDVACAAGGETITQVDNAATVGQHTSIAIGLDGFPVISYYDAGTNTALKVAKCNDAACAGGDETITTVDNAASVGEHTSIAIGTDGFPVISYRDQTNTALKVAKCRNQSCAF